MNPGNSFYDFIILSAIYLLITIVRAKTKKKQTLLIGYSNVYDLTMIKAVTDSYKKMWLKSKYLMKNIDVMIDENPRKMLAYFTLIIMFESFIIYSIIK